jgi:hypothetical protein
MATTRADSGASTEAPTTAAEKPKPAKLSEDFKPNEPTGGGRGTDSEGKPDGSLSDKQVERAATEALLSLRPQPSADEVSKVLEALGEVDEKGALRAKVKTAKEAGDKAVAELNKQRAA